MSGFNRKDFPIFDFSFSNFPTTRLVEQLYAIALIVIVLGFLAMVALGYMGYSPVTSQAASPCCAYPPSFWRFTPF